MAIASGTLGTVTWTIADDGVLSIRPTSGNAGRMDTDFFMSRDWPWRDYADSVTSVVFTGSITLRNQPFSSIAAYSYGEATNMFYGMSSIVSLSGLSSLSGLTNMNMMFYGCSSLTSLDVSDLDVSSVTSIASMFYGCSSLATLTGIGTWDTSSIDSFQSVFRGCSSLAFLDLSGWDTTGASHMSWMFWECDILRTVTFGTGFVPVSETAQTYFTANGAAKNSSNGITVVTDSAFNALTASERAGTWTRGIVTTYRASATRTTAGGVEDEDGESITVTVTYATDATTTERTLTVYLKESSDASYPSAAAYTGTLTGDSGVTAVTIVDVGDAAFDLRVEFYDGTSTFVAFPSVQSNIRLAEIDESGRTKLMGRACYPLFVYATAPDEADLPVTPCFVLATSDYGLWYYDGN